MDNQEKIHIIITGGTIDSKTKGLERDVLFQHSVIPEYLDSIKIHQNLEFTEVCMKDSRDIKHADRRDIIKVVEESACNKIVITHGTFTLVDTAKFLIANLKRRDKTVVLTGSMIPLKFENSDAPANLAFALAQVNNLPAGVYIAMNERIFNPDEAVKDTKEERFYSVNDK